jgi:hypothetical protein
VDIGGDIGVLVVYVNSALLGGEIEISLRGSTGPMTHAVVRERRLPQGSRFAAVFPGLRSGEYTLHPFGSKPARDVTVTASKVNETQW